ncbi:MAG: thioredoxin family protein [Deltaproteobacteria bacterium]
MSAARIHNRWRLQSTAAFLFVAAAIVDGGSSSDGAFATRSKFNNVLAIGDKAPDWENLPGVDGQAHSLNDYREAKAVVVVFTCNHCPVAKMYDDRLIEFAKKYEKTVQVVAISVSRNGADGLEKMKTRASEKGFPFPYLYDETQKSGRSYGATVTPHFFLLDGERKIAYMGAFDDNFERKKAEKNYLIDAVKAVLEGKKPRVRESLQRGCGIDYE